MILAAGPLDVNPITVLLLQPLIFLLQSPKPTLAGLPSPASRVLHYCRAGLTTHPNPTAGQAFPLLTHNPCYSAATVASHRSRTSQPSYSSPCGHPLPRLPQLRIIPFLGLAVVHRRGDLGAAWSTWSRNSFHRTWTVRGEADS